MKRQPRPQPPLSNDEIAVVGRIGAPYGVKGWLHVNSFTQPSENILSYPLWINSENTWRAIADVEIRKHKKAYVARFPGVDERDGARMLTGSLLGTPPDHFVPAAADEVLWRDLIGVEVTNRDGQVLGHVTTLTETGSHDVLVITDEQRRETLVPFADEFIIELDLEAGVLVVDWSTDW